ncbi:MAG: DUF1569 domain-containing protein [Leptospiraceae bacterium]|nr:DUF1569 domain-containing protein [Leptospiraceae bacterium]
MNRKDFLIGTGYILASTSTISLLDSCSGDKMLIREVKLSSLEEARKELESISKIKSVTTTGKWDVGQVFEHCAQSIEYSLVGYPENRSYFFRRTIGRVVLNKFLSQGYMSHNLNDPIPGAPELNSSKDFHSGLERLLRAIDSFESFRGEPKIHFVYDSVSKSDYGKIHAMHIANHLQAISLQKS